MEAADPPQCLLISIILHTATFEKALIFIGKHTITY